MKRPWLRFYDPHVPSKLEYPNIFMQQILDDTANQFPKNKAVFFFGGKVTFGQLQAHVNRFAQALGGIGFRPGDRLGILLPNMPQAIVCTFGALKAGGVPVFFDPMADEEELERQLNHARVETLVVLDLLLRRVDPLFAKTKLKQFIIAGVSDYLPFPRGWQFDLAAKGR